MSLSRLLKNYKILLLVAVLAASIFMVFLRDGNPATVDLNLGIEFIGGTRIPISLEKPLAPDQMALMVDTLKTRINKFGLSQAVVRPLGNNQILVELPQAQASVIQSVEAILREQGRFEALVGGQVALNGSHVIPTGIGGANGEQIQADGKWELTFSVTGEGEMHFANVASGHKGDNVYMFLDRPQHAALIVPHSYIPASPTILDALHENGDDIQLFYLEDLNANTTAAINASVVLIPQNLSGSNPTVYQALLSSGYSLNISASKRLIPLSESALRPNLLGIGPGAGLSGWEAIGLKSAPILQVEPLRKNVIQQYQITGSAQGNDAKELKDNAANEVRTLKSVLAGGRLPVSASVGSYYNIAPSLGNQFLTYSFYAIGLAILLVAAIITLRYRRLELILPIVGTNVIEILVLLALVGTLGTLDLAAMAGVIALIGSGVDNQIVITDELLKKHGEDVSQKRKLKDAFFIVFTTAGVALASMLPLLLSGIVEVMGFALASILGILMGVLITRPAYSVIVEETFFESAGIHAGHDEKGHGTHQSHEHEKKE
ncbi:hypothetical protein HY994_05305 [Candidatus Micrarchaeota archaeon]|nr:hypothetical protein [Candidatus Micrarchaeota archaeon]